MRILLLAVLPVLKYYAIIDHCHLRLYRDDINYAYTVGGAMV